MHSAAEQASTHHKGNRARGKEQAHLHLDEVEDLLLARALPDLCPILGEAPQHPPHPPSPAACLMAEKVTLISAQGWHIALTGECKAAIEPVVAAH